MEQEQVFIENVIQALKSNRLFSGLNADDLRMVAQSVELFQVKRGDAVCVQGASNDAFWLVYSGQLYASRKINKQEKFIQNLTTGECWGQDCLNGGKISSNVRVLKNSILMRITVDKFRNLVEKFLVLSASLQILQNSSKITKRMKLGWLQQGEDVYYAGRRHPVILLRSVFIPILVISINFFMTIALFDPILGGNPGLLLIPLGLCLVAVGWGVLSIIEWVYDYSIVTSLRVVWQQRVAFLYDSRHEAPLSTLQSVDVQTTPVGRLMGYGNVSVHTIAGPLILPDVERPDDVASVIIQHWELSKVSRHREELSKMEQVLRQRLNAGKEKLEKGNSTQVPSDQGVPQFIKAGFFQEFFANLFKVRIQSGNMVTYRKHWFILLAKTWKPMIFTLTTIMLWIGRLAGWYTFVPLLETLLGLAIFLLGTITWWAYNYVDWRNDIYQITPDQIIDLERKPLGKETKKVAQLDHILYTEYKRIGLMGIILNFGTVSVAVGTSLFTFESVYDPSQVQQDLFRRMAEYSLKKKTDRMTEERERTGDWIATYHNNQDEYLPLKTDDTSTPEGAIIS
jgi:hypothetical protein